MLISLFWAPNGVKELLEMCFEFPFNLIGKSMVAFFNNKQIMTHTQILDFGDTQKSYTQFMTILGDHEAAHFTRQGVEVMQFFHEKQGKFCK